MRIIIKIGVLVSLLFFSLTPAFALEAPAPRWFDRYAFTLSPLFGILYGQAEEIALWFDGPRTGDYISQLLWDIKPLIYVGLAVDFGPGDPFAGHGFIAAGSLRFGLPFRSGHKENRDWQNPQESWLTDFSRQEAFIQNAILLDISAGYSWRLTNSLALRTFMEFSFMHFSWSGENGFAQPAPTSDLPEWHSGIPKYTFYGMIIRYSQNWFIFAPGFSLLWGINERFSLKGHFSYTPLIFCRARDDHLLAQTIFWDTMSFGHYINGGGAIIFSPRRDLDLSLAISYRHISGTRGNFRLQDNIEGTSVRHYNAAGAGFSALNTAFAVTLRL